MGLFAALLAGALHSRPDRALGHVMPKRRRSSEGPVSKRARRDDEDPVVEQGSKEVVSRGGWVRIVDPPPPHEAPPTTSEATEVSKSSLERHPRDKKVFELEWVDAKRRNALPRDDPPDLDSEEAHRAFETHGIVDGVRMIDDSDVEAPSVPEMDKLEQQLEARGSLEPAVRLGSEGLELTSFPGSFGYSLAVARVAARTGVRVMLGARHSFCEPTKELPAGMYVWWTPGAIGPLRSQLSLEGREEQARVERVASRVRDVAAEKGLRLPTRVTLVKKAFGAEGVAGGRWRLVRIADLTSAGVELLSADREPLLAHNIFLVKPPRRTPDGVSARVSWSKTGASYLCVLVRAA
jgi:hypothetical protein